MRVLLVEDDEDLAFTTTLALKTGGIAATAYPDCDQAAAALESALWKPDAVLLDMHLAEGMSSREFIAWLAAHGYGAVPVILVSATPDLPEQARALGAVGYVRKPFEIDELVERVGAVAR